MTTCTKCGKPQPIDQFAIDRSKRSGRDSWCRTCRNKARRDRYNAALNHERQRSRVYYTDHREEVASRHRGDAPDRRQYAHDYRQRNLTTIREKERRMQPRKHAKRHGLSPEDVARLRAEQQDLCYLCERPLPVNSRQVHIDHDHSHCPRDSSCSFCRRGIACQACNTAIGLAGDDPQRLRRMADNLERAQAMARQAIAEGPQQGDLLALLA